jgi:chemotaxis protein CheY-P-specific phosphatase CheC
MTNFEKYTDNIKELEEFVTQTAIDNPEVRKVLLLSRDFVVAINANLLEGQPHSPEVVSEAMKIAMDGFITAFLTCFGLTFSPGSEGIAIDLLSKVFALLLGRHLKMFAEFRPDAPQQAEKEEVDG